MCNIHITIGHICRPCRNSLYKHFKIIGVGYINKKEIIMEDVENRVRKKKIKT